MLLATGDTFKHTVLLQREKLYLYNIIVIMIKLNWNDETSLLKAPAWNLCEVKPILERWI